MFVLLLLLAFGLMALNRGDSATLEVLRRTVTDSVTPILELISRPVDAIADVMTKADELANLRDENERLRNQNRHLLGWQQTAQRLEAENNGLRDLMRLAPDPRWSYISARAVGDTGGAYVRSLLINAGTDHGAAMGQAAVTGDGLAGRVLQAGRRSARILLITDINSRIPVVVGSARDRAVLGGDNTNLPQLLYISSEAEVAEGDFVVTSGHGGALPSGIPVGMVRLVNDKEIRVEPFVDWRHLEYLRLIDFPFAERLSEITHPGEGAAGR